jgi:hypothetical protein
MASETDFNFNVLPRRIKLEYTTGYGHEHWKPYERKNKHLFEEIGYPNQLKLQNGYWNLFDCRKNQVTYRAKATENGGLPCELYGARGRQSADRRNVDRCHRQNSTLMIITLE